MQRNVKLIAIKTIKRQTKLAGKRSIDLTEGAKLSGVRCTRMRTVSGCGSGERPECKGTAEGATRAGVKSDRAQSLRQKDRVWTDNCTGT